jgi:gliding motility-associated-like protein
LKQFYALFLVFISISVHSQVVCDIDIRDTFVCSGSTINLSVGSGYTSVLWDNTATTPATTITTAGTHWVRVTKIDTTINLVVNGDFEAGRTGFTSGYIVGLPGSSTWGLLGNPGTYEVLASPRDGHINFYTCTDMTPAPGTQMLVANGSTIPTDFWCQTITVTPNTDYLFSAWVASVENTTNVAQLQFKINGTVIGTPVFAPTIGCVWRQFFTTWNSGLSTSANICIRNLNVSGGGNDFAIDEIRFSNVCVHTDSFTFSVFAPTSQTIYDTICSNNPILFNGNSLSTSGLYSDTLMNFRSCDSFLTLNLTVLPISSYTYSQTICSNQTVIFNGVSINTSGIYLDTFVNSVGCDSFLTLNLTVNPTSIGTINQVICSNQTYLFNGVNLNTSGVYLDTFTNYLFCDSVVTLNLTVNPTSTGTMTQSICSNQTFLFNGVNLNISGTYLDTFTNYISCDSVVTLNLTVIPINGSVKDTVICFGESYLFNGVFRNTTGTYLDTFTNIRGCDSVVRLNLVAMPYLSATLNRYMCDNQTYFFNGVSLTSTSTYLDTLLSINGCDSFITLNLLVYPTSTVNIYDSICEGQSIIFNGLSLDTAGIYADTQSTIYGCDSIIYMYLTVHPNPIVVINAGNDTSITIGQSVILKASGATSYLWDNLSNSIYQTVTPTATSIYYVTGSDTFLCENTDTILITVYELVDTSKLVIPSAFSPNGDGVNDIFRVLGSINLEFSNMSIFNRWGEKVFESNLLEDGWDGNFRGRAQPSGTYVYYITGKSKISKDTRTYNGVVTLIR